MRQKTLIIYCCQVFNKFCVFVVVLFEVVYNNISMIEKLHEQHTQLN